MLKVYSAETANYANGPGAAPSEPPRHILQNIPKQMERLGLNAPIGIVFWTIGIGTCVRLLCAAFAIDLTFGEAYYIANARHFALSYFDHPPLAFWLAGVTMKLTGLDALIVVRIPFIALFAATTWLMYRVGTLLFDEWVGAFSALLLNLSPLFTLSMGAWVEPDGPLIFFILASALCIIRLASDDKPKSETWLWAQAGFWLGLALLSKYYAVLLPVGVTLFALTSREHRIWFGKPGPYMACVIAVAVFSPALIWNIQHHWVSFDFQSERAIDFTGFNIRVLITNILGQAVFVGPWIWIPILKACWRPLQDGRTNLASWFLLCVAWVPILFFTIMSLWMQTHGHYHWQAPGYIFLFPLLARLTIDKLQNHDAFTLKWLRWSILAPFIIIALVASEAATGWAHSLLSNSVRPEHDFTLDTLEWKELRAALAERQYLHKPRLFVVTENRFEVGKVDLEVGRFLPVVCMCQDPRDIAFGWNLPGFSGWDALIIGTDFQVPRVETAYGRYFQSIEREDDIVIHRGGKAVLNLHVYFAEHYLGSYPLPFSTDAQTSN